MALMFILLLLHAYVGWRLIPVLGAAPWLQWLLAGVLLASWLLMPMALLARRIRRQPLSDRLAWSGLLLMGLFSSLFVLTLLRDVISLPLWAAASWWTLPAWLTLASAAAVPVLALLFTLWGLWNARCTAQVVRVDVPIAQLPPALHGFSIAQISDVHVGPTIKRGYLQAIVERVNALQADMVAVTGDLVDGSVQSLAVHVAPLAGLSSRHGTFFVTGNHEYYSGAQAWVEELRRLGLKVLINEHVLLRHGDAALALAGVADFSAHHFEHTHRSDPKAAIAGVADEAAVRVLLAHQPRSAPAAAEAGFHLQLSGHTHGGQFLPWNWFVRLQQPFTAGLNRWQNLWVYTSRGTGYWGPPKRLGAPSEITHLRLVAA
ncbi:MAG: metallophosphoesterase [Burkholderiales bacterium]|nr:metallophosphoesterase [Burkholderiales bacterium]